MQAVEARYATGLATFGDVLNARQSFLQNQDQLADAQGSQRRDVLALYKALGGGWETLPLPEVKPGAAMGVYTQPKKHK